MEGPKMKRTRETLAGMLQMADIFVVPVRTGWAIIWWGEEPGPAERTQALSHRVNEEDLLKRAKQDRRRNVWAAGACLLAATLIYGPLVGAAWASHAMACCNGDHCNIPRHHHQKSHPASHDMGNMDCDHDMGSMMDCSMSCCQDADQPVVTAMAFILPQPAFAAASMLVTRADDGVRSVEIPRSTEPLSPPPRLAVAAL